MTFDGLEEAAPFPAALLDLTCLCSLEAFLPPSVWFSEGGSPFLRLIGRLEPLLPLLLPLPRLPLLLPLPRLPLLLPLLLRNVEALMRGLVSRPVLPPLCFVRKDERREANPRPSLSPPQKKRQESEKESLVELLVTRVGLLRVRCVAQEREEKGVLLLPARGGPRQPKREVRPEEREIEDRMKTECLSPPLLLLLLLPRVCRRPLPLCCSMKGRERRGKKEEEKKVYVHPVKLRGGYRADSATKSRSPSRTLQKKRRLREEDEGRKRLDG